MTLQTAEWQVLQVNPIDGTLRNGLRKIRHKRDRKSGYILNLMTQGLEIKELELEERKGEQKGQKAALAEVEKRDQELVDLMKALVKNMVQE
jgi:hypothetical protein